MDTRAITLERRMTRPAMALAALSALALSLTLLISPALADHTGPLVAPDFKAGAANQTCGSFGAFDFEFKVDDENPNGTYDENHPDVVVTSSTDFEVTIVTSSNVMSWESNLPVDAVFVKGGPLGGNLYDYTSLGFAVTHDNGLTTAGGGQYGISHVSFCFNGPPDETPTPTPVEETPTPTPVEETPTPEQTVQAGTPTPEQSVQAATGTPAASLPDGAMSVYGGPSPLPTVAFGLILVASLGTLAWANVRTARSRN